MPSSFARSIAARPAGAMRSAARSRSTRSLFGADQLLRGFRGVSTIEVRRSSILRALLSIQPKHSASSTMCSYGR